MCHHQVLVLFILMLQKIKLNETFPFYFKAYDALDFLKFLLFWQLYCDKLNMLSAIYFLFCSLICVHIRVLQQSNGKHTPSNNEKNVQIYFDSQSHKKVIKKYFENIKVLHSLFENIRYGGIGK